MRAVRLGRPCHVVVMEDGSWKCVAAVVVKELADHCVMANTMPWRGGIRGPVTSLEDHGPGDERGGGTVHWLEKCPGKDLKVML